LEQNDKDDEIRKWRTKARTLIFLNQCTHNLISSCQWYQHDDIKRRRFWWSFPLCIEVSTVMMELMLLCRGNSTTKWEKLKLNLALKFITLNINVLHKFAMWDAHPHNGLIFFVSHCPLVKAYLGACPGWCLARTYLRSQHCTKPSPVAVFSTYPTKPHSPLPVAVYTTPTPTIHHSPITHLQANY
jgi:hypothetical protein